MLSRGDLEQFAPPGDIYDRPASIFVNTFVGSTNLLPGTLLDGAAVRLDGGAVVPTGLATTARPGDRGGAVGAAGGHRPVPGGRAGRAVRARHRRHADRPALIYQVALADGTVAKIVQDRADALPGDATDGPVFLTIKPDRASGIFPLH